MQKLVITLLCTAVLYACNGDGKSASAKKEPGDSTYVLSGKIDGLDSGWVYLVNVQKNQERPDSVKVTGGNFEFKGYAAEPQFAFLALQEKGSRQQPLGLFLESGTITIKASKDSLSKGKVTGSAVNDEYQKYYVTYAILDEKQKQLYQEYQAASMSGDAQKMETIQKQFEGLEKENKDLVAKFVKENPASYVSPFLVAQSFTYEIIPAELEPLYNSFDEKIKASYFGKTIKKGLDDIKKTDVGSIAPDFTLNDLNGKPVSLASYKGKYILVDFWASWCGPCRQENPAVVKAYNMYKAKGFDILGVSLDEKKGNWEKAIKEDQLGWTHVSDLKGWQSDVAALYGVKAIPMNYLVDKDGKIIAKSLRGEDLMKKLGEVLN